MSWEKVLEFEAQVAKFFGSKWAVATDSCTHAVELCLRLKQIKELSVPKRTYLSIPFLAHKLNIPLTWRDENWEGYYFIGNTNIADAAVFWEKDGYIPDTFMCLSFQFQKHLSLGRGGMILTDDKEAYMALKKMSYDGRHPHAPWREQNIDSIGYHYYMTPETAALGLEKLEKAIYNKPKIWSIEDYPDLTEMQIFK
jgi:dTDP-4-amino-4,6-dideoxygalactose transaminase|tara:strand:+ start:1848 stop:2438 length:591 start_codon:yes stop_codon:yes gene_type:complete